MKLRNTGLFYFGTDGTAYRGKITMSYDEWKKVEKYLCGSHSWYDKQTSPWTRETLWRDIESAKIIKGGGFEIALRITATEAIVKRFKPVGSPSTHKYKKQNYTVRVYPMQ